MLKSGAQNIRNNAKIVNDLNVFPIPDGDTGENMCLTIEGGLAAIDPAEPNLGVMLSRMAGGMLMNARGNSGVILSQFFGGLAKGIGDLEFATIQEIRRGFKSAVEKGEDEHFLEHYGDILWFNDEKEAAVEQWSKALEMDPDNELLQRKVKDKTYYEK